MTFKTYIDFETDIILYDGKTQTVRALEGHLSLEDLNGGIKPGDPGECGSSGSKSCDTNQRNEDLKKYNKLLPKTTRKTLMSKANLLLIMCLLCRLHVEGGILGIGPCRVKFFS